MRVNGRRQASSSISGMSAMLKSVESSMMFAATSCPSPSRSAKDSTMLATGVQQTLDADEAAALIQAGLAARMGGAVIRETI